MANPAVAVAQAVLLTKSQTMSLVWIPPASMPSQKAIPSLYWSVRRPRILRLLVG